MKHLIIILILFVARNALGGEEKEVQDKPFNQVCLPEQPPPHEAAGGESSVHDSLVIKNGPSGLTVVLEATPVKTRCKHSPLRMITARFAENGAHVDADFDLKKHSFFGGAIYGEYETGCASYSTVNKNNNIMFEFANELHTGKYGKLSSERYEKELNFIIQDIMKKLAKGLERKIITQGDWNYDGVMRMCAIMHENIQTMDNSIAHDLNSKNKSKASSSA